MRGARHFEAAPAKCAPPEEEKLWSPCCGGRRLDEEIASDSRRETFLRQKSFRVLRMTNADVFNNLDGACEMILCSLS
jgi:hypothetical protein